MYTTIECYATLSDVIKYTTLSHTKLMLHYNTATPFRVTLKVYFTTLCATLHKTTLLYTTLFCTKLHRITPHHTILRCTTPHHTTLYYAALHHITLY